jgi:glycosyltransferase involved in cell wall biosynthesis
MRLVPSKRTRALIDIFADVVKDLPRGAIRLDLYGAGPEEWLIRRRIRRRHLDEVVALHGRTARTELKDVYGSAHVFCAPATREAFGIAVLEARTAGLIVVGRAGTGIQEFITHEADGLLVSTDEEMARELVRLAVDTDRLAQMSHKARENFPPFGVDRVVALAFAEYERARAVLGEQALSSF